MKVFTRRCDGKNSGEIFTLIFVPLFMLGVMSIIIYFLFKEHQTLKNVFLAEPIIFCIFPLFIVFSLYIVYFLLKPTKYYKAKLIHKEIQTYDDENVHYMIFELCDPLSDASERIACFTKEENNFMENQYYAVKLKEAFDKIYRVEYMQNMNDLDYKSAKYGFVDLALFVGLYLSVSFGIVSLITLILNPSTKYYCITYIIVSIIVTGFIVFCSRKKD